MAFEEERTKWHIFLEKLELEPDNLVALKNYVDCLLEKNTPIILNPEHLSKLLGIRLEIIQRIVYSTIFFYYSFKIPKKSGGFREISTPYPVLLSAQKWIYENILARIAINKCATGFVRNKSIIDNVKCHLGTNDLLKMDIVDFFPSINFERIMSIFLNLGYPKSLAYYLTSLCCLDGKLPQGAPTSPMLSNIIAKRLDRRLSGLAAKLRLNYSRYADDMTFSGSKISPIIIKYISEIVHDEGFEINQKKTKLIKAGRKKIVTGISICSGKMTIPRAAKREIKKDVFYVQREGVIKHTKNKGKFDPIFVERLIGKLHFWRTIEPQNQFVLNSIKALTDFAKTRLDKCNS